QKSGLRFGLARVLAAPETRRAAMRAPSAPTPRAVSLRLSKSALASTYVPHGKAEPARTLLSRIRCGLRHRRKRSHKLSGINCVSATIQLRGREPVIAL